MKETLMLEIEFNLKNYVKRLIEFTGYRISKINPPKAFGPPSHLNYHNIDLIFDVGANTGQYALKTRTEGYANTIVSFEPLPDAFNALQLNSRNDPQWIIHDRCAIGRISGETLINVSKNSQSSSILKMLDRHSSAAPDSAYISQEPTKIISIDSIFNDYRKSENVKTFLKIDTQGFENEVLAGATKSMKNIIGLELELSLVPLYENQYLYRYFLDHLEKEGFYLWAIKPGFYDPITGQQLQIDAIFFRDPSGKNNTATSLKRQGLAN